MPSPKHDNFVRLRDSRLEKAVKSISLLSNLASQNYEYSREEAEDLVNTLQSAVDAVADMFQIVSDDPTPTEVPTLPLHIQAYATRLSKPRLDLVLKEAAETCTFEELKFAIDVYEQRVREESGEADRQQAGR